MCRGIERRGQRRASELEKAERSCTEECREGLRGGGKISSFLIADVRPGQERASLPALEAVATYLQSARLCNQQPISLTKAFMKRNGGGRMCMPSLEHLCNVSRGQPAAEWSPLDSDSSPCRAVFSAADLDRKDVLLYSGS
jgi:hypothetical protein